MKFSAALTAALLSLNGVTGQNVVEIASSEDDFSTLASLVVEADLAGTLSGDGPFLVYAPTNDAFEQLDPSVVEFLLQNDNQLRQVLQYHVVPGGGTAVTDAESEIQADNGIIRVIDTVLIPSSVANAYQMASRTIVDNAVATPAFSTLVDLLEAAGLVDTLLGEGPFTVFAPTNDAFGMLDPAVVNYLVDPDNVDVLRDVLTYHVVSGRVLSTDLTNGDVPTVEGSTVEISIDNSPPTVNGVDIISADLPSSNGVIHVISNVLVPPNFPPADFMPDGTMEVSPSNTIVENAIAAGDFTTLVNLVVAAGLDGTLSGNGPFTVFAPTDEAFSMLDPAVVTYLTNPNNVETLREVLTYHVIGANVLSTQLTDGDVTTLEGSTVDISLEGAPTVNGVEIVTTDVVSSNGVIHVISSVLVPPNFPPADFMAAVPTPAGGTSSNTIVQNAIANDDFSTLVDLVSRANLVNTLSSEGPFTVFAPTNDAFDALDTDTVDYLLESGNVRILQEVLKYHVVSGRVLSTDLRNGMVTTVEGSTIDISVPANAPPTVNGIDIVAADIESSNGVIHVISNVLVPPNVPPTRICRYQGINYLPNDWAMGPTLVCRCVTRGWTNCESLDGTVCGNECVDSSSCGGDCPVCDPDTSMCVPELHGTRNLREDTPVLSELE